MISILPISASRLRVLAAICALALLTSSAWSSQTAAAPLPEGTAAELGFAKERLDSLDAHFRRLVDEQRCSGFVTLLVRHGRIADWRAYGYRDVETGAPMERDTIFRIYSNSKLVTSAGAMILFEEGRLDLEAPVEQYLPEFKDRKVLIGGTADAPELVPAKERLRVWHLLTHTGGYRYHFGEDEVGRLYQRADLWSAKTVDDFIARAATLPLVNEPGAEFRYGISSDLVGALIERISGQSLEEFLQTRIFQPLKMQDTSFGVAPEKAGRLAKVYRRKSAEGGLKEAVLPASTLPERGSGVASGGGGLFSTAGDYARFAQMLLNGGELDGVRILSRASVARMTENHLGRTAKPTHAYSESRGFGFGAEVVIDPIKDPNLCSRGQFGWYGSATTQCQVDPSQDLVAIAFFQHQPMDEVQVFGRFADGYNAALIDRTIRQEVTAN